MRRGGSGHRGGAPAGCDISPWGVGMEEVKALTAEVRAIDDRLRRLETLLFHIPVPDIQRIIKVIEAAGLELDAQEAQPEQEVAPEEQCGGAPPSPSPPAMRDGRALAAGTWGRVDPEAAFGGGGGRAGTECGASGDEDPDGGEPPCAADAECTEDSEDGARDLDAPPAASDLRRRPSTRRPAAAGGDVGGGNRWPGALAEAGSCCAAAREELMAQQDFKDNVLGSGLLGFPRPQIGEVWRFTDAVRIFQLFDDELGRATTSRMGPTKGSYWREESRSFPQLVTVTAAPPGGELVEVRGRGDTASWLRGWVRLRDERGRPLLEPDRL